MTDIVERMPDPQRIAPVKAAPVSAMCNDWPIAYQTGNSQEDGEDWGIVTDNVRASLFLGLDFPIDAKDDAEFLAYLVNAYRTGHLVPADRITALRADLAEASKTVDLWQKMSRETFEAMCAMRNAINEHIPMPSLESDLLQGPEASVFCAAVAEAVIAALRSQRAEVLREAAEVADHFRDHCGECNWPEEAVIVGANVANDIGREILALIDAPKEQQP